MDDRVVDLAAAYAGISRPSAAFTTPRHWRRHMIPSDMMAFLARWPVGTRGGRARARLSPATSSADGLVRLRGAHLATAPANIALRIPLRPRRIKDYLVFEAAQEKIDGAPRPADARALVPHADLYQPQRLGPGRSRRRTSTGPPIRKSSTSNSRSASWSDARPARISRPRRDAYVAASPSYNDFSARDVQAEEGRSAPAPARAKTSTQGNVLGPCIVDAGRDRSAPTSR